MDRGCVVYVQKTLGPGNPDRNCRMVYVHDLEVARVNADPDGWSAENQRELDEVVKDIEKAVEGDADGDGLR